MDAPPAHHVKVIPEGSIFVPPFMVELSTHTCTCLSMLIMMTVVITMTVSHCGSAGFCWKNLFMVAGGIGVDVGVGVLIISFWVSIGLMYVN